MSSCTSDKNADCAAVVVASSLASNRFSSSAKVSSVTRVSSPLPGAVTRVMTPRRSRKRRMRLPAPSTSCSILSLAGRGRGVEHAAFALAVGAVDTVEEEGVKVRRKSQVAVGPLDGGHRTGFAIWQAALDVAFAIPLGHRIGEDAEDLPKVAFRRKRAGIAAGKAW